MITKEFGRGKGLYTNRKPNDNVRTPEDISKLAIDLFDLEGKILDPFMGEGSFYNQFPEWLENDWCEIDRGRDFFEYNEKVDWIISNPPYSILDEVLKHSFEIADNIVYLVPLSKVVSSMKRVRAINEYGGVPFIYILASSKCGFNFGFPSCIIHIKKNYKGDTKIYIDGGNNE